MEIEKNATYHRAAIKYNEELATFAAKLAKRLDHPEVAHWAGAVSRQHKYHARGHRKALERLQNKQATAELADDAKSVSEQQAEFAASQKEED